MRLFDKDSTTCKKCVHEVEMINEKPKTYTQNLDSISKSLSKARREEFLAWVPKEGVVYKNGTPLRRNSDIV
jgi:hypothetical protein